jgi:hypothetical protein
MPWPFLVNSKEIGWSEGLTHFAARNVRTIDFGPRLNRGGSRTKKGKKGQNINNFFHLQPLIELFWNTQGDSMSG